MKIREIPEAIEERDIISLPSDSIVKDAVMLITGRKIGALPVVDDGKLVGIFSERDIISRVLAVELDVDTTTLDRVMTPDPLTVTLEDTVEEAIAMMTEKNFRHIPVVDEDGMLLTFLSQRDFMQFCWNKVHGEG